MYGELWCSGFDQSPEYVRKLAMTMGSVSDAIVLIDMYKGFKDGTLASWSKIGGKTYSSLKDIMVYLEDEGFSREVYLGDGRYKKESEIIFKFLEENVKN